MDYCLINARSSSHSRTQWQVRDGTLCLGEEEEEEGQERTTEQATSPSLPPPRPPPGREGCAIHLLLPPSCPMSAPLPPTRISPSSSAPPRPQGQRSERREGGREGEREGGKKKRRREGRRGKRG